MSEEPWMKPVDIGSDLPLPRFRLGDRVFFASTSSVIAQLPCPDCLGTKRWECTSPAGGKGTIDCPRCSQYYRPKELPPLSFTTWKGEVRKLTVGLIKATAANTQDVVDDPVSYMCLETGIGSGSVYRESMLSATREEAEERAERMAEERRARDHSEPKMIDRFDLGGVTIDVAMMSEVRRRVLNDYGVRWKMMDVLEVLSSERRMQEEGLIDAKSIMEHVHNEMSYINHFYVEKKNDELLVRVEKFLSDLDEQLQWGPDSHKRFAALEEERKALLELLTLLKPKKERADDEAGV